MARGRRRARRFRRVRSAIRPQLQARQEQLMGWSFKLFDVAGTAVRVHFTFFLLLAWIARDPLDARRRRPRPSTASSSSCCCSCAWCCTSSATSFAARRYGIRTSGRDAAADRRRGLAGAHAGKTGQEIFVALAGPAVNLVIALVLMVVLGARFDLSQMAQLEQAQSTLIGPGGRRQRGAARVQPDPGLSRWTAAACCARAGDAARLYARHARRRLDRPGAGGRVRRSSA